KQRHIKVCSYVQLVKVCIDTFVFLQLIPIRGLDNDNIEWIKITEAKNATTFVLVITTTCTYICVAIKKTLLMYEITRKKTRYSFWREIQMPLNIQTVNCCNNGMIAIG